VLDTRGFVYLKLGQTENAIKDYDAALKLNPKLAGSLYGRGLAKTRKGDRNGGTARRSCWPSRAKRNRRGICAVRAAVRVRGHLRSYADSLLFGLVTGLAPGLLEQP
jgi:tetratricopeptide (TPR) repeat protein